MQQIEIEAIDYVSHHWTGCVDGNIIGVFGQPDVRRRCWKVGQIVIEERWRLNSALYHSCFNISAFRYLLPQINFGSPVQHIAVEPVTDCCRHVGVVDTIEQLLMSTLSNAAVRSSATSTVQLADFF